MSNPVDNMGSAKVWNWLKPWQHAVALDAYKSDTVDLDDSAEPIAAVTQLHGFSISVAGAVKVTLRSGTVVTFPSGALTPGVIYHMRVKRLWSTGTAATGMMGWSRHPTAL